IYHHSHPHPTIFLLCHLAHRPLPSFPTRRSSDLVTGHGYLLARTSGPEGTSAPTGFVVGGNLGAEDDAAAVLAGLLEETWERVLSPDAEVVERLRAVEQHFGVQVLPEGFEVGGPVVAADVLVPGARVCFSGTVRTA